jgi:undecaprenyl-diphosphatase
MKNTTAQQEEVKKKVAGISLGLAIVVGFFLACLAIFVFIADEMVLENENRLDIWAFQKLAHITNTATTNLMVGITFFGSSYFLLPAYALLVLFFLFKRNRKLSINITAIGITSTVILFSLKYIFHRHRPLDPLVQNVNGFSFPSGHSFSSFTFFGLLIYILWNTNMDRSLRWVLSILFFLCAAAIAFSRVYLHVHYASDVVAGFCLCIMWLLLSFWGLEKFNKKRPA